MIISERRDSFQVLCPPLVVGTIIQHTFHTPDSNISVLLLGNRPQLQLKHRSIALVGRGLIQHLQKP